MIYALLERTPRCEETDLGRVDVDVIGVWKEGAREELRYRYVPAFYTPFINKTDAPKGA